MEIWGELEKLGLSIQEAKVYVNTLKLGSGKASEIAQKSKITREAVYYVLNLLREKGFVSEVIKSGVKYYSGVKPQRLLEIVEEEKERKENVIKDISLELEKIENSVLNKPKIEIYEGKEGFKSAVSILLQNENSQICVYASDGVLDFLPMFNLQFRRRRREKNIFMKVLTKETSLMKRLKLDDDKELREIRFTDIVPIDYEGVFYILKNGILILKVNGKEQIGIYVPEEESSKLQKKIFDVFWDSSKK